MISRVCNYLRESRTILLHGPNATNKNNSNNKNILRHFLTSKTKPESEPEVLFDAFINHRGTDTKRTIATLLHDDLSRRNLRPFLDNRNMKPGDKLFDHINRAILDSKVAVAVFSPNYCDSYFCLHELALIMESKKRVIPIFCDIKPSELNVMINREKCSDDEIRRFRWALDEAKDTVGLTFDSLKGNLSEVVKNASDIVFERLMEIEAENKNI